MRTRDSKKPYEEKGAYSEYAMTHEQIGAAMGGISRATVGVYEKNALAKFKRELERRGIKYSDLVWR